MYVVLLSLLFRVVTSYYSWDTFPTGENYDPSASNSYDNEDQYFDDLTELIDPIKSNDYNLYPDYYDLLILPWAEYEDYNYDIQMDGKNNQEWVDVVGYLKNMTTSDFQDLIASLDFDPTNQVSFYEHEKNAEGELPILHRRKRRSRSRSSSSSSRSTSNSRSSSSSSRRGWSWGRSRSRTTTTSRPKVTYGWNSPTRATTTAPKPSTLYPTANYPPARTNIGNNNPNPVYPSVTKSPTLASNPSPLYPTGNYPPTGTNVAGNTPRAGYPPVSNSPGSYPQGNVPYGSSPPGNYPVAGYPPSGHQPSPGYPPTGRQPAPGYPSSGSNPSFGYPPPGTHQPNRPPFQPSAGYPHPSAPNFGPTSVGSNPNIGYPGAASGPFAKPKLSKKQKIAKKVKEAIKAYGTYKLNKKMRKKNKFMSPSHFGMGSHMYDHGSNRMFQPGFAEVGKKKKKNKLKKVIGRALKLAVAMYAIKYGVKAAKAYAEYKLGRSLKDAIIEKFVSKYHRQHTRIHMRERKRFSKSGVDISVENITLGENCARNCYLTEQLVCFFDFRIHLYQTLSRACYNCPNVMSDCERPECIVGSGRRKLVSVVNRQMPGPTIEVCEGDKVIIRVHNEMPSSAVTLHVRGQNYQDAQYYEGTPGVTQDPISPGDFFTYTFKADTSGTHFWHANTGVMRSEGVFGPFIVKEKEDPHGFTYDIDLANQTLTISEELVKGSEEQLILLSQKKGNIELQSLLINGRGIKQDPASPDVHRSHVSYARIKLLKGKRHRLRIVSAVSTNCPFTFRIPGQQFQVIYADGFPVNLKETRSLLVSPGERFDIVLSDLDDLHWIEVRGNLECDNQTQYAILESIESSFFPLLNTNDISGESDATLDIKLPLNNPKEDESIDEELLKHAASCNSSEITCVRHLTGLRRLPHQDAEANLTFYLSLTDRKIHNEHIYSFLHYNIESIPQEEQSSTWQINNLTLKLPSDPLLLNDRPLKNSVCSLAGVLQRHCVESFCECLHLMEVPLNSLIDLVVVNEGLANSQAPQTMYFHGHNFWLISQTNEFVYSNETEDNATMDYMTFLRVIIRNSEDLLIKNLENPVRVNSITVPEKGYAVIRFRADNPGYWLLESSSVFKAASGMGVVIKIGEKENLPPIPRHLSDCNKSP